MAAFLFALSPPPPAPAPLRLSGRPGPPRAPPAVAAARPRPAAAAVARRAPARRGRAPPALSLAAVRCWSHHRLRLVARAQASPTLAHSIGTDRMPHLRQVAASLSSFRHPDQGRRITSVAGSTSAQVRNQPRIVSIARDDRHRRGALSLRGGSASRSSAPIDRRSRQPSDLRDHSQTPNPRSAPRTPQTIAVPARRASNRSLSTAAEWRPRRSCHRSTPVRHTWNPPHPNTPTQTADCNSIMFEVSNASPKRLQAA